MATIEQVRPGTFTRVDDFKASHGGWYQFWVSVVADTQRPTVIEIEDSGGALRSSFSIEPGLVPAAWQDFTIPANFQQQPSYDAVQGHSVLLPANIASAFDAPFLCSVWMWLDTHQRVFATSKIHRVHFAGRERPYMSSGVHGNSLVVG